MTSAVRLPLRSSTFDVVGTLEIGCLPRQRERVGEPLLIDLGENGGAGGDVEAAVQLLEEAEYSYRLTVSHRRVMVEPQEMFNPTDIGGLEGRLRPGRSTGTVSVIVHDEELAEVGTCEFEVRSRKLDYLSEYRWMLQRIAAEAAEILQSHFASSSLGVFRPDTIGTAETLYQRFAFIQSLLSSAEFEGALQVVLNQPHHEYRAVTRTHDPALGARSSRTLARQLFAPGPRQPLAAGCSVGGVTTLPLTVSESHNVESYDTVPNRFVRFALEHWRDLAEDVATVMRSKQTPATRRGLREATELREQLEGILTAGLFREVGALEMFPAANTVLQGRSGYREVLRAFLQSEAAAVVDWAGQDTVFAAGQRDVATLYEYWVFFELIRLVESCSGFQLKKQNLFRVSGDKLSLELRRGRSVVLSAYGVRRNRVVELQLWFNRQFRRGSESWTEPLRPDCSLRISPAGEDNLDNTTWIHFDAKYRVQALAEIFRSDAPDPEWDDAIGGALAPLSDDLLKMHAYRDAIRRTSGAFVLYPGRDAEPVRHSEYHEILPGLGAFVLRPTATGEAEESSALSLGRFIEDVLDHVASQGTDQQRANYWTRRTYREHSGQRLATGVRLRKPPADTTVLLGFTKSAGHQAWIGQAGLYNMRADGRRGGIGLTSPELAADYLCLYGSDSDDLSVFELLGSFVLRTGAELQAAGYPEPRGTLYCCVVLGAEVDQEGLAVTRVRQIARRGLLPELWGSPRVTTWSDLHAPESRV